MAARWGAGEDTLTACSMSLFPLDTLDETPALSSEETLGALQSCLDPSILSIFEDTPTTEPKGLDEESEATLLTALTEILDNVDDENLSPFDTLPDSELLSGQKARELSPFRRLLCLSRSPPEKEIVCSARPLLSGKSIPRLQTDSLQRSDGEEEEDGSLTLSPLGNDSSPDNNLLEWEGLANPLPVTFEQDLGESVSVSLGDLVRHMHPYCMSICVENEEGEQMLPEGGILLEVVDQGENGEPILAIPDVDLSVSLPCKEQNHVDEAESVASDSLEHIVVDDDDDDDGNATISKASVKVAAPLTTVESSDTKDEMIVKRQKGEIKERSPSRRKKKKKLKGDCPPKPVEGRVLKSGTVRNAVRELPKKPLSKLVKEEKKVPKVPLTSPSLPSSVKPKKPRPCQRTTQIITATLTPETNVKVAKSSSPRQELVSSSPDLSCLPTIVSSQQPDERPNDVGLVPKQVEESSSASSAVLSQVSSETPTAASSHMTTPVCEAPPPLAPVVTEPKPKLLSLADYRLLRQQKKPAPLENLDYSNRSKWPSLPELPKELPPIPCLPGPSSRDPRRNSPQTGWKKVEEVKPAWQPRGPCAPPTPEALLVPPAYMVSSTSKVPAAAAAAAAPKPQQTPEPLSQKPPPVAPNSVKNLTTQPYTTALSCVPCSSDPPASLKAETQFMSSASEKSPSSPTPSGADSRSDGMPQAQPTSPKCVEHVKPCNKTTTEAIEATAALSALKKSTAVFLKVPEVSAHTLIDTSISSDNKSSKTTDSGAASAACTSDSLTLKVEPTVPENKVNPITTVKPQRPKSPTQELIDAFTSEIGIEAADLTSLLEQFEETQAKEEQCVPGVSGRAAAVGNSGVDLAPEKTVVERVKAHELSSTAALTPPATPPHQMWKPLAPVALLGKSKSTEVSKSSLSKVIQIDPRPLHSIRSRSRPAPAALRTVAPEVACQDHDYCLPSKAPGEPGNRWNIKHQPVITIKAIKPSTASVPPAAAALPAQPPTKATDTTKTSDFLLNVPLDHRTVGMKSSSVLETPDSSPARQETLEERIPRRGSMGSSFPQYTASQTPSPISSPKEGTRGRSRKRSHRTPSPVTSSSDTHSSRSRSRSHSPSRKRYRSHHSRGSSSSSCRSSRSSSSTSCSPPRRRRYSYSSSRSGSWSRSRSRSVSSERGTQQGRFYRPSYRPDYGQKGERRKEKAIEERRVVYVGRIRGTMTQKELRERFSLFGEIEDCTLHFRNHGDNYGFVTYYDTKDAFAAIENGSKMRKPDELPFDLCFGGRRQFCQTSYADLDSSTEYNPLPVKGKIHALDFDTLLKQAKQNLKR